MKDKLQEQHRKKDVLEIMKAIGPLDRKQKKGIIAEIEKVQSQIHSGQNINS